MAHKDNDIDKLRELIKLMKENSLAEIEISHGGDKVYIKRAELTAAAPAVPIMAPAVPTSPNAPPAAAPAAPAPQTLADEGLVPITSPIVGTFYAQPSPDSEPFVEVGSKVTENTIVCIVEAMKVMNEIKAEVTGTIVEIVVSSGQAVEYGQTLFKVKPD
jgi:acetyl-CoA carboxylase biotin carboxyl carrier protein